LGDHVVCLLRIPGSNLLFFFLLRQFFLVKSVGLILCFYYANTSPAPL
jgi:hypothetical protein